MKHLVLIIFFFSITLPAFSQFKTFEEKINITDSINLYQPREKIFIHYDKPYYKLNDTIWMKGYVLNADENEPADSSGIAYIEIINALGEVVKRISTPCYSGRFFSNILLAADDFKQGAYLMRAYTNWMRNFGDSLFFESPFKIVDPASDEWKITVKELSFLNNRLSLYAGLKSTDQQALGNKKMTVRLLSKNKTLFKKQMVTDYGGYLFIDSLLGNLDAYKNLRLEITDKDSLALDIPVKANDEQYIDLQFLPEGGTFIAGTAQQLGFKAVNLYGKGVDVKGEIKDSKGNNVAGFSSIFKGMGVVSFTPQLSETYTALLENGLSFKLPSPQPSGTVLQIINNPAADSLTIKIDATHDLWGKKFYFSANIRGLTGARGHTSIFGKPYELKLSKKLFPSGIVHFTVYDETYNPLNERVALIWHGDNLRLTLEPHKQAYQKKDSVMLKLRATNYSGENIAGSFSIAVLDSSQVRVLPNIENLLSYMVLSSDLKGEIEEPYYYFNNPQPAAIEALMLTQGWVSYNWYNAKNIHPYEKEFTISGKVTNIFNKPFQHSSVTLFGKEGAGSAFFLDTLTSDKGTFTFTGFPYFTNDSINIVIRALNKRGKAFNVGIDLIEPNYPPYTPVKIIGSTENILFDTLAKQFIDRQAKVAEQIKRDGHFLADVTVTAKMKIPGSKNLNGDGADETITEKILDKTPKLTLLDVIEKNVKGFHVAMPPKTRMLYYMINSNLARFVIDGVDLNAFYYPAEKTLPGYETPTDYTQYLDGYLKYFSAEDIKGIEVMNYPRYNSAYRNNFLTIQERMNSGPATRDYSFIEITTKTGSGPFIKKTPGMYLYKPLAPVFGKQFYSPKYSSPQQETVFPDMRSTIYWNPEVITDSSGEAGISFYTSESKRNYYIILQGTDLKGGLGVLQQPLFIKKEE